MPAVSELFKVSVKRGLDGGEFVTPKIQFSTELIRVDDSDGNDVALGLKLETPPTRSAIKTNTEMVQVIEQHCIFEWWIHNVNQKFEVDASRWR